MKKLRVSILLGKQDILDQDTEERKREGDGDLQKRNMHRKG